MIPLTVGFLLVGPLSGILSDRFGARPFATGGLVISGASFLLLELLPMNFHYVFFALLVFMFAIGMGLFFAPNQSAVMNSLPPEQRGAGAGMLNTFQNSATVLSMGLFFTIVTLGLAADLPKHLYRGLIAAGVASGPAHLVASEPPIGSLFSAFLGFNPVKELLGPTGALTASERTPVGIYHRTLLLPEPDRAAFRERSASRFRLRRRSNAHSCTGIWSAWTALCAHDALDRRRARRRRS